MSHWSSGLSNLTYWVLSGDNTEVGTKQGGNSIAHNIQSAIGQSSGKYYFEIYFENAGGGQSYTNIGFIKSGVANNNYPGAVSGSWGYLNDRYYEEGSYSATNAPPAAANHTYAIAIDIDAGEAWLLIDDVVWNGGDPKTGTSPCWSGANMTGVELFPAACLHELDQVATLRLTLGEQVYAPPAGFSPWIKTIVPYATFTDENANFTLSDANLTYEKTANDNVWGSVKTDRVLQSGKLYWEILLTEQNLYTSVGVFGPGDLISYYPGQTFTSYGYTVYDGKVYNNGSNHTYGNVAIDGDILGVALDLDNGKIFYSLNGVWQASSDPVEGTNPAYSNVVGDKIPAVGAYSIGIKGTINSTFTSLVYKLPAGFSALEDPFDIALVPKDNKIRLTIPKQESELVDFPVLVNLSAESGISAFDCSTIFDELGINSKKVAVEVGDTGVQTYAEIENWTHTNSELQSTIYDTNHAKSTSIYSSYYPHQAFNPALSLIGGWQSSQWLTNVDNHSQKVNVYMIDPFILKHIILDNSHSSGTYTASGIKDFILYGTTSYDAFLNTTYADTTDLVELGAFTAREHVAVNAPDPETIEVNATVAYRFYVFRIANNHGDVTWMGIRHIAFYSKEYTYANLWVNVPIVSATSDTILHLYYDASQVDNNTYIGDTGDGAAQQVWNSGFGAVYHMAQDPTGGTDCILDSTSNTNHGTPTGSMTSDDVVDELLGKALEFDGVDDSILCGTSLGLSGDFSGTIEANVKPSQVSGLTTLFSAGTNSTLNGFGLCINEGELSIQYDGGNSFETTSTPLTTDTDYNLAVSKTLGAINTTTIMYVDGVFTSGSGSGSTPNFIENTSYIAQWSNQDFEYNGQISELRISNVARSADWLSAVHLSNNDSLITFSIGAIDAVVQDRFIPAFTNFAKSYNMSFMPDFIPNTLIRSKRKGFSKAF